MYYVIQQIKLRRSYPSNGIHFDSECKDGERSVVESLLSLYHAWICTASLNILPIFAFNVEHFHLCQSKTHAKLSFLPSHQLDARLAKDNYVFSSFRVKGSIGLLEMHWVTKDGFSSLRKFLLSSTDASANQLKIPRLLRRETAVTFLTSLTENQWVPMSMF